MPPRKEHPAKGWAAVLDRSSIYRTDIRQETHHTQDRINNETLRSFGLKLRPGYRFSETGVSASKSITRKDLEKAINAIVREKVVEALVVQDPTRLTREGSRHMGEMLDAVEAVGGRIIFARGPLDSSVPHNRAIIAFLAEQAREEANTLAWRIGNWRESCRLMGRWMGHRPYGHLVVNGRLVPHPDEAPIVRRIVEEILRGKGLRAIAKMLNEEGIPSPGAAKALEMRAEGRQPKNPTDTEWNTTGMSKVLHNPSLVGWQRHNGKIVLGADGDPVSFGEGILTPGEHARVILEIERRTTIAKKQKRWGKKREAGSKTGGGRPPRYLLSKFARCAACDYAMIGYTPTARNPYSYRCDTSEKGRTCPAPTYIAMESADQEVMRQLRTRLGAMEPDDPILDAIAERWRELMMPEDEGERAVLQSRLAAVRGRIVDLDEARYLRGEFTTPDDIARWNTLMERLKLQRDAVQDELDVLGPPPDFNLATLLEEYRSPTWDVAPIEKRRRLFQVAVAKVVITSARKNRHMPVEDRVQLFLVGEGTEE